MSTLNTLTFFVVAFVTSFVFVAGVTAATASDLSEGGFTASKTVSNSLRFGTFISDPSSNVIFAFIPILFNFAIPNFNFDWISANVFELFSSSASCACDNRSQKRIHEIHQN